MLRRGWAASLPAFRSASSKRFEITGRPDGCYRDVLEVAGGRYLTVRRAVPEDHDQILGMDSSGGAYDRGDYLHGGLRRYLHDPDRMANLAVLDDKIVGFVMQRLTDGGHHVAGRMARVHREVRSTGVWDALRYLSAVDIMSRWPKARMYFGCTSSPQLPFFQENKWGNVLCRPYVTVNVSRDLRVHPPRTGLDCRELNKEACEEALEDPTLNRQLFPTGMAVVGREPFLIHPINFDSMAEEASTVQGSRTGRDPTRPTCMSFGTGIRGHGGTFVYDCAIYSSTRSPAELAEHVHTHIPIARALSDSRDVTMNIFGQFPEESDMLVRAASAIYGRGSATSQTGSTQVFTHVLGCFPLRKYYNICKESLEKKF